VRPLNAILNALTVGFEKYGIDEELRRYLRDVQDHVIEVAERVEGLRQLLQNILSVNLSLVSLQQNEEIKQLSEVGIQQNDEVKKVSAWAAILFAPTVIGTVYGMNFDHMPELHWLWLPVRALADGAGVRVALRGLQEARLALRSDMGLQHRLTYLDKHAGRRMRTRRARAPKHRLRRQFSIDRLFGDRRVGPPRLRIGVAPAVATLHGIAGRGRAIPGRCFSLF
jgi:hypothetical protein